LLEDRGLILKEKKPVEELGRPRSAYSMLPRSQALGLSIFSDSSTEVMTLSFRKLSWVCRFEKGGYYKRIGGSCEAWNCPQILGNKNHLKPNNYPACALKVNDPEL
jgi:hypothetical protein